MTDVATGAPSRNGHQDGHGNGRPLAGLVAVSLAQNLPGPLALEILAADGIGAIKVEPPSGDLLSHAAPRWYAELGQGIDTRQIDLRSEAGKAELDRLLGGADLLITSQRPSALSRLGVTVESLARVNPRLCWVEIVGDCDAPEVPGHDLTYQIEAGLVAPPAMPRTLVADLAGARDAARTALLLLLGRDRGSALRHRRVGLRQAAQDFAAPVRHGMTSDGGILSGAILGYRIYRLADGWAAVAALEPHFAAAFSNEVGADPESFFAARTVADASALAQAHDLPISAIHAS